jgi:hypothetical protein
MEPGSASAEEAGMSRILSFIFGLLSHNLNHYIEVRLGDRRVLLCTRCTGMLLGFITSLPILLALGVHRAPGNIVAGISICLFLPDFVYWALTRTKIVPDLNSIRVFNGFLLGVSIAAYGQANLPIGIKIAIILLLWALVFLGNPVIGRLRRT